MKWLTVLAQVIERIPLERLLVKPPSNKKSLESLQEILSESHAKPPEAPPEEIPEEAEEGHLEPRRQRVHLAPKEGGLSTEETVAYQNREIGKLLLRMERHYAQKLRINGIPCDCLVRNEEIYAQSATCAINKPTDAVLTHKGQVKSVTRRIKRKYHGDIRRIKVLYTNIPLLITPEHPVLGIYDARKVNWRCNGGGLDEGNLRWISAGELIPRSFIAFPRLNYIRDMQIITLDFAELLGWYVAEGSKGGNRTTFSLDKKETSNIEIVNNLMINCLGKEAISRETETAIQLDYTSKAVTPIFAEFGSMAIKKQIPEWFLYLPFEKQFRFLKGYIGGDGYPRNVGRYSIGANTVSPRLAYGLRLLLYRLGILHGLYKRHQRDGLINGRVIHGNGTRYEIQTNGEAAKLLGDNIGMAFESREQALRNMGWVSPNYVFIPVVSNEVVPYDGMVYNISVEDDESYLTVQGTLHNCGSQKHLLDLESLCEETVSMVDNDIYYRIIDWTREVAPKSTDQAAKSGKYDNEYPTFSRQARDLRKEIIGSLEPSALFTKRVEELPATEEEQRKLPETQEITEGEFEKQRKDLLTRGIIT